MKRIAKFEKVSYEQFEKDYLDNLTNYENFSDEEKEVTIKECHRIYDNIKLPKRATKGSAGYDFYLPYDIFIPTQTAVKVVTGIRCFIEDGWVLKAYPRSGHGFKFGVHLANTVGIIDSDYYNSSNEGHIQIKLVNDSRIAKDISLKECDAFCQGLFIEYGITYDDDVEEIRDGGFGSTSKK